MNDELIPIVCDACQARLRVKSTVFSITKSVRCSKCGANIILAKFKPGQPPAPAPAPAPVDPAPAPTIDVAPPPAPPAVSVAPPAIDDTEKDELRQELATLRAELTALQTRFKAVQQELFESDARIADLQQLWHGKEIEGRELAERAARAETAAKQAIAERDAFLARIKDELSMHLLKERDASLQRFAELEQRMRSLTSP